MTYTPKPLPFEKDSLDGISQTTIDNHYEKLYKGYVTKYNETQDKMATEDKSTANQSYSPWRGLKSGETFALDAIILHELYFENLGGDGSWENSQFFHTIEDQFGSMEEFIARVSATGMAARGWAVVAFDPLENKIGIYAQDAHDHGAIWLAKPLLVLDVYEHAYYADFGADRKSYIETFWKNVNWEVIDKRLA